MKGVRPLLSVVVPLKDEADGIKTFHESLISVLNTVSLGTYEVIYVDDGSTDQTLTLLHELSETDTAISVLALSRNFGKEQAIAAGIALAQGDAVILLDGDGQHPVSVIPALLDAWHGGAQVVVGRRTQHDDESFGKRLGSKVFYAVFKLINGKVIDRLATDFRLLDREVVDAYLDLHETDRLNRYLIDWLGFKRAYVPIDRTARIAGASSFNFRALSRLALDTLISSSSRPLYILCFAGVAITAVSFLVGLVIGFEQFVLQDPLNWNFTGTALLSILVLFFVGIILTAQGVSSLYIATIYNQVKQRPLYVVNRQLSRNIHDKGVSE